MLSAPPDAANGFNPHLVWAEERDDCVEGQAQKSMHACASLQRVEGRGRTLASGSTWFQSHLHLLTFPDLSCHTCEAGLVIVYTVSGSCEQ